MTIKNNLLLLHFMFIKNKDQMLLELSMDKPKVGF